MKKKVIIQKIHLEQFIDHLMKIYEEGAIFFDIVNTPGEEQDVLQVVVRKEYFEPFEAFEERIPETYTPINDELLNSLICQG